MGPDDQDGAWLIDCTAWATARHVTLVGVGTPIVKRKDGKALGAGDIVLSDTAVVTVATTRNGVTVQPGYGFFFSVTAHGNATRYYVGFPLTDSSGDVVTRWGELPVIAMPG
jgi:hypothetical protein